eukprot:TRINITY_DN16910_c0_g1_i2.p1 TRINITY_DN16910_c0_g1~~TRINITY_DN16910_c0_g1_i2.p1  ORF type:complete len:558 (-),score=59.90 TRINITY_DN16910_c0_g1_i2:156-1829(-)
MPTDVERREPLVPSGCGEQARAVRAVSDASELTNSRGLFPRDLTHLCVLIAIAVGLLILLLDLGVLIALRRCKATCATETVDAVFILPCTVLLLRLLQQYDDRYRSRLKAADKLRKQVQELILKTVEDMHSVLQEGAKFNVTMAERSFMDSKRDFIRFLSRVDAKVNRDREWSISTPEANERFVQLLREFIRHWLTAFSEASVNPRRHPLVIEMPPGAFDQAVSLQELTNLVKEKLAVTSVHLLEHSLKRHKSLVDAVEKQMESASADAPPSESSASSFALQTKVEDILSRVERGERVRCSWLICCGDSDCSWRCEPTEDSIMNISCKFCSFSVINAEHFTMLCAFIAATTLCVWTIGRAQLWESERTMTKELKMLFGISPIALFALAVFVLLMNIERISIVARVEEETRRCQKIQEQAEQWRLEIKDFWMSVQDRIDFWRERTIPRLELLKELHESLTDEPALSIMSSLEGTNRRLEKLGKALGTAQHVPRPAREIAGLQVLSDSGPEQNPHLRHGVDLALRLRSFDVQRTASAPTASKLELLLRRLDQYMDAESP